MVVDEVDVVIIGAGLSGIGAACHLKRECPTKSFAILEGRSAIGGTWDLFRYPGVRSDSDMYTLGYHFKPWRGDQSIAEGASIRRYVEEAAVEHGVPEHIRFSHRVVKAEWSSAEAAWTIEAEQTETGDVVRIRGNLLLVCSGYYSYEQGHTPPFEGRDRFEGEVIHPQQWPEDLDYRGKKVVVIGSGATAVTLVPAMANDAEHVVMLQRSPTYVVSAPGRDAIARGLGKLLPERAAYSVVRWKNSKLQQFFYRRAREKPGATRARLLSLVQKALGPDYDVEKHFTPSYNPWDERLCLIPDGDLFEAINRGDASVVTDEIETFTEGGLRLRSGRELDADIIVTATGLNLELMGGVSYAVDGEPVDFGKTHTYRGMMCSGVPNFIWTFGYINASWTLRADLISRFACRLVQHMDATGARSCVPELREEDREMAERPWIADFTPGYMERSMHLFPRQGDREPWINTQNYAADKKTLAEDPIDDGVLRFEGAGAA